MDWFSAPDYTLGRFVFQRLLGLIYLVAFLVAVNQFRPLLGSNGLQPAPRYMRSVPFRESPSIFYAHYSDGFFTAVAWLGVVLSAVATFGLCDRGPIWLSMLVWLLLWVLYQSIVNVGQTFYSFGWESLLLEAGFLAIFLGPSQILPPTPVVWLLRWLLFRVEFGAGLIKMRGDSCWRDLTCLYYHHETQPMPNALSWYFHHLPKPLHRIEVAGNHFTQLVVPFGLFAPQPVSSIAALVIVATQSWLLLSGNFSWLNLVTITLALANIDNSFYAAVLPALGSGVATGPAPMWHTGLVLLVTALTLVLSYYPVRNMISGQQVMNRSFNPLHLVNTYGAFGSVTRKRFEVILEGSDDLEGGWKEYEFKGKPGTVTRRPSQFAPYHLRLDWLMWFAALRAIFRPPWLLALIDKLLENDRPTLALLRHNPFPERPPKYVRALLYEYRFTTPRERRETGAWWVRTLLREHIPPASLRPP